jgi:hypothetical protein
MTDILRIHLDLVPDKKIVQSWRGALAEGHFLKPIFR